MVSRRIAKQKKDGKNMFMNLHISFPKDMHIDLVQSNELRHYEIFGAMTSLFLSAAVGFLATYISTAKRSNTLLLITFTFSFLHLYLH